MLHISEEAAGSDEAAILEPTAAQQHLQVRSGHHLSTPSSPDSAETRLPVCQHCQHLLNKAGVGEILIFMKSKMSKKNKRGWPVSSGGYSAGS